MGENVYSHSGQRIPVRMRDGAPVCPDPACDETTVEVDPGMWRCPDAIAADRAISDGLAALRDRVDGATAVSVRVLTDETTIDEVFAWHEADSPECRRTGIAWRSTGFGCRTCGWVVGDPCPTCENTGLHPPGDPDGLGCWDCGRPRLPQTLPQN